MPTTRVLIRPRRSLLTGALVAFLVTATPVFGVLYYFGAEHGGVRVILGLNLAALAIALAALTRQLMVHCAVTDRDLKGSGILTPLVRVPLERIAEVLLLETYVGQTPGTVRQLLVRDADGRRLFRLRGNFWHADDVDRLVDALPVPPTVVPEPMSSSEFFRDYPGSAYWFENQPWLRILLVVVGLVAIALLSVWIMMLIGLPVDPLR